MELVRSGRLRWGVLLLLLGAFLVLQHMAEHSYYEGSRYSDSFQPDLRDPALEKTYTDRAKALYSLSFLVAGAFAFFLLLPVTINKQIRGGSTLSRPRTALITTLAGLTFAALFGVAHFGLGEETVFAWGPVYAGYYSNLPVLILHLTYFAVFSNVLCVLRKTIGWPVGVAGAFLALTAFLLAFGQSLSWLGLV